MPTKKTAKKIKNVLIISASFRPNSNSHALCQEVAKGVQAAENTDWDIVKAPLQGFVDCFDGAKIKGFLKAGGVYEPGAVKKTKFMKAAFDLGRRI